MQHPLSVRNTVLLYVWHTYTCCANVAQGRLCAQYTHAMHSVQKPVKGRSVACRAASASHQGLGVPVRLTDLELLLDRLPEAPLADVEDHCNGEPDLAREPDLPTTAAAPMGLLPGDAGLAVDEAKAAPLVDVLLLVPAAALSGLPTTVAAAAAAASSSLAKPGALTLLPSPAALTSCW